MPDLATPTWVEVRSAAREGACMAAMLELAVLVLALDYTVEPEIAYEMVSWRGGLDAPEHLESGGCLFGSPGGEADG